MTEGPIDVEEIRAAERICAMCMCHKRVNTAQYNAKRKKPTIYKNNNYIIYDYDDNKR